MESHHQTSSSSNNNLDWSKYYFQQQETKTKLLSLNKQTTTKNVANSKSSTLASSYQAYSPLNRNNNKFLNNFSSPFCGKYPQQQQISVRSLTTKIKKFEDENDHDKGEKEPKKQLESNKNIHNKNHLRKSYQAFSFSSTKKKHLSLFSSNKRINNQDVDHSNHSSPHSSSSNLSSVADLFKKSQSQQQFEDQDWMLSAKSQKFRVLSTEQQKSSTLLLDWLENELDQRGIDSVIYGRYLLSLLQQYPNNSDDQNSNNVYDHNLTTRGESDNRYESSITTNTNTKYFNKLQQQKPILRYCESHQKLYRGSGNCWSSSYNPNYSSSWMGTSRPKDNTQKAPTTTKWMHKRYLQQPDRIRNKSPTSCYNSTIGRRNGYDRYCSDENSMKDDHNDQDDFDDFDASGNEFDQHCPDCQQKSKKYTKDYRKFMLLKCLKSAVDKDSSSTCNIETLVEELCYRFDQQQQMMDCQFSISDRNIRVPRGYTSGTSSSNFEWMLQMNQYSILCDNGMDELDDQQRFSAVTNKTFTNKNSKLSTLNRHRYHRQKPKDNDNNDYEENSNIHDKFSLRNFDENEVESDINNQNNATKTTAETILDQAKKYYDAFPALGSSTSSAPKIASTKTSCSSSQSLSSMLTSGSNSNGNSKTCGDYSSICSTTTTSGSSTSGTSNRNNFGSHQSSFDDSVFIDNNTTTTTPDDNDVNSQNVMTPILTSTNTWNGQKIIKNIVQNQSKLSLLSTHLTNENGSTILCSKIGQDSQIMANINQNPNNQQQKPTVVKLKSTLLGGKSRTGLIVAPSSLNEDNIGMGDKYSGESTGTKLTTLKKLTTVPLNNTATANTNINFNSNQQSSIIDSNDEIEKYQAKIEKEITSKVVQSNPDSTRDFEPSPNIGEQTIQNSLSAHEMEKIYQIMPSFLNPILKTSTTASTTTTTTSKKSTMVSSKLDTLRETTNKCQPIWKNSEKHQSGSNQQHQNRFNVQNIMGDNCNQQRKIKTSYNNQTSFSYHPKSSNEKFSSNSINYVHQKKSIHHQKLSTATTTFNITTATATIPTTTTISTVKNLPAHDVDGVCDDYGEHDENLVAADLLLPNFLKPSFKSRSASTNNSKTSTLIPVISSSKSKNDIDFCDDICERQQQSKTATLTTKQSEDNNICSNGSLLIVVKDDNNLESKQTNVGADYKNYNTNNLNVLDDNNNDQSKVTSTISDLLEKVSESSQMHQQKTFNLNDLTITAPQKITASLSSSLHKTIDEWLAYHESNRWSKEVWKISDLLLGESSSSNTLMVDESTPIEHEDEESGKMKMNWRPISPFHDKSYEQLMNPRLDEGDDQLSAQNPNQHRRIKLLSNLWSQNCTLGYMDLMDSCQNLLSEELSSIVDFVQSSNVQGTISTIDGEENATILTKRNNVASLENHEETRVAFTNDILLPTSQLDPIQNQQTETQINNDVMDKIFGQSFSKTILQTLGTSISSEVYSSEISSTSEPMDKWFNIFLQDDLIDKDQNPTLNFSDCNCRDRDDSSPSNPVYVQHDESHSWVIKQPINKSTSNDLPLWKTPNENEPSNAINTMNYLINVSELINDVLESSNGDTLDNSKQQTELKEENDCLFPSTTTETIGNFLASLSSDNVHLVNQKVDDDEQEVKETQTELTQALTTNEEDENQEVSKLSGPYSKRYRLKLKSIDKNLTSESQTSYFHQTNYDDDQYINGHIVTASYPDLSTFLYLRAYGYHQQQHWSSYENIQNAIGGYDPEDELSYYYDPDQQTNRDPSEVNHFIEPYGNDLYDFENYFKIPKNGSGNQQQHQEFATITSIAKNNFSNNSNFLTKTSNIYDDGLDIKFKLENRSLVPDNDAKPVQKPCAFYLENACARVDCKFSHDISSIPCKYYLEGACYKEEFCPFLHEKPKSDLNEQNLNGTSLSKLDPNAKSFQFKIESDSDFPSLFDSEKNTYDSAEQESSNNPRVNFVFKNSKMNNQITKSSSDKQLELPTISRNNHNEDNRRRNQMSRIIMNSTTTPNSVGSYNFAKCFSPEKQSTNHVKSSKLISKDAIEEEWPSLSGSKLSAGTELIESQQPRKIVKSNSTDASSKVTGGITKVISLKNINNRNSSINFRDKVLIKSPSKKKNTNNQSSNTGNNHSKIGSTSFSSLKSILNAS